WYLFCPKECGALHECLGKPFKELYEQFTSMAEAGQLKLFKKLKAKDLWKDILRSLNETGHPWITFKDSANECYMQSDQGIIHQTNLCTEIFRHNIACQWDGETGDKIKVGETAVCNLGSVNLNEYGLEVLGNKENIGELENDIPLMIEMLDNVVTNNYYPIASSKKSNLKHRPVGLGLMGFQDFLHKNNKSYNDSGAEVYAAWIQENIAFNAIR